MMKKDISERCIRKMYQKYKILLIVLHNIYELDRFVTMATYWVPDLLNIKGLSGHP